MLLVLLAVAAAEEVLFRDGSLWVAIALQLVLDVTSVVALGVLLVGLYGSAIKVG